LRHSPSNCGFLNAGAGRRRAGPMERSGKAIHSRLKPTAASRSERDALPDLELAALVEFKATEKTGIETSARLRQKLEENNTANPSGRSRRRLIGSPLI
jgi:hypothetical protein